MDISKTIHSKMFDFDIKMDLSGERFRVVYAITGGREEARKKAEDICVEQTIEFPAELVTGGDIRSFILGRVERFEEVGASDWHAEISFAIETAGNELTQLLNVVFGNFSLKPGVRVERMELPERMIRYYKGPRFGVPRIREMLGVHDRPFLCTALKPMGLPSSTLARLAYTFASGGVDMIKDDHGLADQPFSPFKERVEMCAQAVTRANQETGRRCLYFPNVSAPAHAILEKARWAKACGAGGIMVAPGLIGYDTMRMLADDDSVDLPIICHPSLLGSFVTSRENGISHYMTFGQLPRLAGADAAVYPNYGGRFTFTLGDCKSIVNAATKKESHIKPMFSAPGGGMNLDRIPEMIGAYGIDSIFLIGGALHKMGPDLIRNCKRYMDVLRGV